MTKSLVTDEMRSIVGLVMRESLSHPVALSDIRKWAIAVYYPEAPPRQFWDEEYAATTQFGGIVVPFAMAPLQLAFFHTMLRDWVGDDGRVVSVSVKLRGLFF